MNGRGPSGYAMTIKMMSLVAVVLLLSMMFRRYG
jgi:hypothetical protein